MRVILEWGRSQKFVPWLVSGSRAAGRSLWSQAFRMEHLLGADLAVTGEGND